MNPDDDNLGPSEVSETEFMADAAVAFIQRDLLAGDGWRLGFTLGMVLDRLLEVSQDADSSNDLREFSEVLVLDIAQTLLYAEIQVTPTEDEIDRQASIFRDIINRGTAPDTEEDSPK